MNASQNWQNQLKSCKQKGRLAFALGKTRNDNPYKGRCGVNLQRRGAWIDGFEAAKHEDAAKKCDKPTT